MRKDVTRMKDTHLVKQLDLDHPLVHIGRVMSIALYLFNQGLYDSEAARVLLIKYELEERGVKC